MTNEQTLAAWLTIKDVAIRLGITTQAVNKMVQKGKLPYRLTPHGRIYDPEVVEQHRRQRSGEEPDAPEQPAASA